MQVLAITLTLGLASQVGGRMPSEALAAARTLYAAAEYEEALSTLSAADPASDVEEADKYRALCLLALGRTDEVERVLEGLVTRSPWYRFSDGDVTPRLVALFQDTRRRLLPGLIKDSYAAAQASFDAGRYTDASSRLRALLTILASDEAPPPDEVLVRQDLRRVAEHFLELAEQAQANAGAAGTAARDAGAPDPPSDQARIRDVLERYVAAYEALDADGVVRVFQGESRNPLRAAFDALRAQRVQTGNVRIDVDPAGGSATVSLTWIVETIPRIGSPKKTQMPATFRMLKVATGEWFIVSRR